MSWNWAILPEIVHSTSHHWNIMSNLPSEVTLPQLTLITQELFTILKSISKNKASSVVFLKHCARTGERIIQHEDFVTKYGSKYCKASISWHQRQYRSGPHEHMGDALEDVYQQIVSALIAEEIKKIPNWQDPKNPLIEVLVIFPLV